MENISELIRREKDLSEQLGGVTHPGIIKKKVLRKILKDRGLTEEEIEAYMKARKNYEEDRERILKGPVSSFAGMERWIDQRMRNEEKRFTQIEEKYPGVRELYDKIFPE